MSASDVVLFPDSVLFVQQALYLAKNSILGVLQFGVLPSNQSDNPC